MGPVALMGSGGGEGFPHLGRSTHRKGLTQLGWGETYRRMEDQKGTGPPSPSSPLKPWGDPSEVLGLNLCHLTALGVGKK